ncbi:hypothetical protein LCGC14_1835990 [marine sediment metagenome]|uniref:Uncharacterized protein n=1 Tax=marine sediment metagenome TaxID=412755 RepID=A0A0F9H2V3_9ZZZZ
MTTCPNCGEQYVPDITKSPDFTSKRTMWRGGQLIQNVWPEATTIQREQLQTGICSDKCWDEYLGAEE